MSTIPDKPDEQILAKLNIKAEVMELLCWHFVRYLDFAESVWEVRGGPLLELISVHFRPKIDPVDDVCKWSITAKISACPPIGTFPILSLPPHTLAFDSNGFAPLPGLESGSLSVFPSINAQVHVKDVLRDCVLLDAPFILDYKDFKEFDQVQFTDVDGPLGTLRIKHITYRAALISIVTVSMSRIVVDGATDDQVMVSGTIIGSCHYDISDVSLNPPFDEPNSACITLFDSSYQVPVTLGQDMHLSVPFMAVPSYSYLALHINLNIAGFGSVNKIALFKPIHSFKRRDTIEGPQDLILKVTVDLAHECQIIFPMGVEVTDDEEDQTSSTVSPLKSMEAKVTDEKEAQASSAISPVKPMEAKVIGDEEPQPSSFFLYIYRQPQRLKGDTLMEVFSTFIFLKNGEPCKIHGKVEAFDALRRNCCIYDHDDNNAEEISGNNRTISLQGPHDNCFAFEWNALGMNIDLKVGDRQFCKGVVCWTILQISEPWLDNHMCSVIKGDLGYAAVYHGIFKKAVQAKLRVFLSSNVDTHVSGSIFGEHGNFDYVTHFERECYRSVIFSRGEEKAEILCVVDERAMPLSPQCFESERSKLLKVSGIELSLLKSVVVVPKDACLVLEVDLLAKTSDRSNVEVSFKDRVEFEVGRQTCWVSSNKNCEICVFVDWDTVFK